MAQTPPVPTYTLLDGTELPAIGFGTYPLKGPDGVDAVVSALRAGYRLVDTAVNYGNEAEVGEALRRSGVPREEVLVTSKLPGRDHGYDEALASIRGSLERLGCEYLDLHLIHWPNPSQGRYLEAWRALVTARDEGLVRSPGVSNFTEGLLEEVVADTGVTPVVNQVELHPAFPQVEMRGVHARLGVRTESWSPLGGRDALLGTDAVRGPAERYGVTGAQVVLRWHVQLGSVPLPKSADPTRQRSNLDVFGFELDVDEMVALTALARPDGRLFDGDPRTHEEM